jgi:hypothetical protein
LSKDSIRSWRIRFGDGRWVFLLQMVPNLILSILFWRVRAYDALTISALLVDRILQIATVIVFPISLVIVLISPVRIARIGAVVASICSLILGLSASVNALRPPIDILPTMLALVCLIIGVASLVWLTHNVMLASRWRFSFIGLLALLPIIQFWHGTSFVPARLVTSMGVSSAVVEVESETKSDNRVILQFELRNASEVGAVILTSRVVYCSRSSNTGLNYNLDALYSDPQCIAGQVISDASRIDGNTTFPYHAAFSAPKDRPFLQLLVSVWYARSDRLRIAPDKVNITAGETASCSSGHIATYRLLDESKIKGLVQKDRFITFEGKPNASTTYSITTEGQPLCGARENDLTRYFGATFASSIQTFWLSSK